MPIKSENLWPLLLFRACQLGVSPKGFWQLSVREWRAITAEFAAQNVMTSGEFKNLAADFED